MRHILKSLVRSLRGSGRSGEHEWPEFGVDERGMRRRQYESYQSYREHQASKLDQKLERITRHDEEFEDVLYERLAEYDLALKGKRVVCLAARLGGEVRAFKRRGAFAVGIDLEPGENNQHVLYGDFHDLQFPPGSVDVVYFNSVDHAFDVARIASEVRRVLHDAGRLILEIVDAKPAGFEALDTSQPDKIIELFSGRFDEVMQFQAHNRTAGFDYELLAVLLKARSG